MKALILTVSSNKKSPYQTLVEDYLIKIKYFLTIDFHVLSPVKGERADQKMRREGDSEKIISKISKEDLVILFDEKGRSLNSIGFSQLLEKAQQSSKKRIVFIVGGPYGVSEKLKAQAWEIVSLSNLTMNHHLALLVVTEQIYRAFSINKGLPYHNE